MAGRKWGGLSGQEVEFESETQVRLPSCFACVCSPSILTSLALKQFYSNLPASLDQANISNGAPSYSASYLSELKANTPSSRRPPTDDSYDADMSLDIGDISMESVDDVDILGMFSEHSLRNES